MMKKVLNLRCSNILKTLQQPKNFKVRNYASGNIVNLDESTLTGRLMIYLKPQKTDLQRKTEHTINSKEAIQLLKRGSSGGIDQIIQIIKSLNDSNSIKENKELFYYLRLVDDECCYCLKNMQPSEILDVLDSLMDLISSRVPQMKFYEAAINKLHTRIGEMRGKEFMRFIFYVGLMKKCGKSQEILRQSMRLLDRNDINQWTSEDICVIANSTFKTSTKISNRYILTKIKNYLNDNLMLMKDPAFFITLLKSLRHNRYYSEDLMATITCALFFNKSFELYTFQTYCHLLAFYSDNLYYDEPLLDFLSKKCMKEMIKYDPMKTGSEEIRLKDIVRLLWGFSSLNSHHLNKEDIKKVLMPLLLHFAESSEFSLEYLIDVLLYLWILNYRSPELFPYLIDKQKFLNRIPDKSNAKQRLNQLLTFLYFEDRPLFKEVGVYPQGNTDFLLAQHLKDRDFLGNVLDCLKVIGQKMNMKFEVGYQIPYMNILGIVGYTKNIYKSVNIEVLDDFTTLKNTEDQPTGLMQTKLRILDGAEEALIVLNKKKLEDQTQAEIEQYLQDELELVC